MPTFTITLRVSVPGLGVRQQAIPNIVAPTLEDAIQQARQQVAVETVAAEKTAN